MSSISPKQSTSAVAVDRRGFLATTGVAAMAVASSSATAAEAAPTPEDLVQRIYRSLDAEQRKAVCFDWDYVDPKRGLLRTRIAANWQVTPHFIYSDFYTQDQQKIIRAIFEGLVQPEWIAKFDRQLTDDAKGFGHSQSLAFFGKPGDGKFQLAITGRHITMRCDGGSEPRLAFGGPIFYGHAASGFREKPGHPGNIFWHQAVAASAVYKALDDKQQRTALLPKPPRESAVGFRGHKGSLTGVGLASLSDRQFALARKLLESLVEPYRQRDRDRVAECLKAQGGLEKCHLTFYEEGNLGHEGIWDTWRLEGPAFVWHFHGVPHVHTWVHVGNDPTVELNS